MCANKLFAHYIIHALIQMLEYGNGSTGSSYRRPVILTKSVDPIIPGRQFLVYALFQLLFDKDEK